MTCLRQHAVVLAGRHEHRIKPDRSPECLHHPHRRCISLAGWGKNAPAASNQRGIGGGNPGSLASEHRMAPDEPTPAVGQQSGRHIDDRTLGTTDVRHNRLIRQIWCNRLENAPGRPEWGRDHNQVGLRRTMPGGTRHMVYDFFTPRPTPGQQRLVITIYLTMLYASSYCERDRSAD